MRLIPFLRFMGAACLVLGVPTSMRLRATPPEPLTRLTYRIDGAQLKVTPPVLSVPKGIPGSVSVAVAGPDPSGASASALTAGAHLEALLHGPSFDARRIVSSVNEPMLLPPLNLVGDYQLDNIRLVDSATGAVRMEATPSSIPIHVFDEVLISRVTSRPLTYDEIQEKGITVDQSSFRAVEFEVGFVLDGKTIPVRLPVVTPTFSGTGEIIPKAELEAKLVQAASINQQISSTVELPPELQRARLNIDIQGINFQKVEANDQDLALSIPPIPALMVIPGNIGYLHQFFSVQIFTENGAPAGSGLSVLNVQAQLALPPGPDLLPGTYDAPGDDPLRFARVGPDKVIRTTVPVVRPGPDGKTGTSDDIARLYSGESGQGEFLVEGLQEGLHVLDLSLTADLDGLAAGLVKITGKASGAVLVRNPTFSLAFSHPRTTRAGEPYDAYVTILNTSSSPANQVSVTLPQASLSGGILQSPETVQLGNIPPGQTATAHYRVLAQRTGAISFSNLTTGDDAVTGRFRLHMGVDERGVALSPDTIGMPDYVNSLPDALLLAMSRVLGQALSVATAAQLPSGVIPASRSIITRRVLEMAEAGQRLRYGDSLKRVLPDLLLDWQGGRSFDSGFDQILRTTDAGRAYREAIAQALDQAEPPDSTARLLDRSRDLAGLSEPWTIASGSDPALEIAYSTDAGTGGPDTSLLPGVLGYRGPHGAWTVAGSWAGGTGSFRWTVTNSIPQAELALLVLGTNGTGTRFQWTLHDPPLYSCYTFSPANPSAGLLVDTNCDGTIDGTLAALVTPVVENPPDLVGVVQDPTVLAGRPSPSCLGMPAQNYATILALLYSKPMNQQGVNIPAAYTLDNGNSAGSVQIQPGGRVALLNMRQPVGGILPRWLTASGVTDVRGEPLIVETLPIQSPITEGIGVRGRVVRSDGNPAGGIPVTLTIYDQMDDPIQGCEPFTVHVSQLNTDPEGYFVFDLILGNAPYSVSATDTRGLPANVVQAIMEASSGDALARQKLYDLVISTGLEKEFLAAFNAPTLPEAITAAQGIDRALLRDMAPAGSARIGTVVPVALRFRGRGSVSGTVFASNGITPLRDVAVNLYPDPGSREQPRGMLSDMNGRFSFAGVPLGPFTLQAQSSAGLSRTVAADLTTPGGTIDVPVVLSPAPTPFTGLLGQVLEHDGITPHPGAQVFVGTLVGSTLQTVVASATTDASGLWSIPQLPLGTYDLVAFSFDGRHRGVREKVPASPGLTNQVTLILEESSRVVGRVETSTGAPVADALVAGGEAIVRTDANGLFTLTGVPPGRRSISAGLPVNPAAGITFPRLGSTSIDVLPGLDNTAVIRLAPAGRIIGRVLDSNGAPVPNVRVCMPEENGFEWVVADAAGNYSFEGIGLGHRTLSAPAPGTAATVDVAALQQAVDSGSEDQLKAAIGQAYSVFTGVSDPYLNGAGATFNPGVWGFTSADVSFDGQTVVADIHYLGSGTIAGLVKNGQGVPIGARVRLTGIGPLANGMPATIIRGEMNSDPALGNFQFPGQALTGSWGLQAASPFYPSVITISGQTTLLDPNATNLVLQFPPAQDVNGRLVGRVFNPGGRPAGSNVNVKISFGSDYIIRTDTNGFFDTQIKLPARGYSVEAEDPASGLKGLAAVNVVAGITNRVDVQLLGRGALSVTVLQADGTPAAGATIRLEQGSYPQDHYDGVADAAGKEGFGNLFEGTYAVCAQKPSGPTTLFGRSSVVVDWNTTNAVIVTLTPTANLTGTFLASDLRTPIAFAQVSVGTLGFATTDSNGLFSVTGIPLGTYRLVGQDAVNGRVGTVTVALGTEGETRRVQLVEQALGEVHGVVINSYRTGTLPGAAVTLSVREGLAPDRTVTTGPDGSFSFPGTPAGELTLSAADPASGATGMQTGTLSPSAGSLEVNIPLQALATLHGVVLEPGGRAPATHATVRLTFGSSALSADTGPDGGVTFVGLPLGTVGLRAASLDPAHQHSITVTNLSLDRPGSAPDFLVQLPGVGSVSGRILDSAGAAGVPGAQVLLTMEAPGTSDSLVGIADPSGHYGFNGVALGAYRITVTSQALSATHNGSLTLDGQSDTVDLTLGSSGSVAGRVVRADGETPVPGIDLLLTFASQSGLPGRAVTRTDATGGFQVDQIPLGLFQLEAIAPGFNGIVRRSGTLLRNAERVDLGSLPLDEASPAVLKVSPANTEVGVSIQASVDVTFTEVIDPASLSATGIYLRSAGGIVPGRLQLLAAPDGPARSLVRLTPDSPLQSQVNYDVIVVNGTLLDALGGVAATGPRDLVGRALDAPFISHFTTADQDPPRLISSYPARGDTQIDPRAVLRLSFSEPVRGSNFLLTLNGPRGPVAGSAAAGLNGLVLGFTPAAALEPNATYTVTADGIRDLAGNLAVGQPYSWSFATLDTLGPEISLLHLSGDPSPIAGATLPLEARLATPEPGASVRFTQDFAPLGLSTNGPRYTVQATLPASGQTTLRAIATDRYGNDGPVTELTLSVVSNLPPVARVVRRDPPTGPIGSGQSLTLEVSASDDLAVTNLTLIGLGAVTLSTNWPGGATNLLHLTLPASASPADSLQFRAQASDSLGLLSSDAVLTLEIADATPPVITRLTPTNNAVVDPAHDLVLTVTGSDNSTNYQWDLVLQGALVSTQTVRVVTLAPNSPETRSFTIPMASAPRGGGTFTARLTATDSAGNTASLLRTYFLPDTEPPSLITLSPPDGAARVNPNLPVDSLFSEAIAPSSVTPGSFGLRDPQGVAVPGTYAFSNGNRSIRFIPGAPLALGTRYTLTLGPGLTDLAGNGFTGTVAHFITLSNTPPAVVLTQVSPAPGSPVGSGSHATLSVSATSDLGITNLTVTASGAVVATNSFPNGALQTLDFVIPPNAVPGTNVLFLATATDTFGGATTVGPLPLQVVDATPPSLEILTPAEGALLSSTPELQLQVAGLDNGPGYELDMILSGSLTATQHVSVVTPANTRTTNLFIVPLPGVGGPGGPFTARVTATDGASNQVSVTRTLRLPDTEPPTLLSISPSDRATKVNPLTPIVCTFSEPLSPASVGGRTLLMLDSHGRQVGGSYALSDDGRTVTFRPSGQLEFGSTYSLILTGAITDLAGNPFGGLGATFKTVANLPPLLTFTPTLPTGSTVGTGATVSFAVEASSDLGITSLFVVATGPLSATNTYPDGAPRTASFTIPPNTLPGTTVEVTATAVDAFGGRSSAEPVRYAVIDATPPTVVLLSPRPGVRVDPSKPLAVEVITSDNGPGHTLQVELSGPLTATQSVAVAAEPLASQTNRLEFPLTGLRPDGSQIQVTARARDAAGNTSSSSQTFLLTDTLGPWIVSRDPQDGAEGISLWRAGLSLEFSEAVAPATLTPESLRVLDAAGSPVPVTIDRPGPTTARLQLSSLPLAPGTTYSVSAAQGVTDLLGNPLTAPDGSPVPPAGLRGTFRTASFSVTAPLAGAAVPPQGTVAVTVQVDAGLGADFIRMVLADGAPVDAAVVPGSGRLTTQLQLPTALTNGTAFLQVSAVKVGLAPYALPPIPLKVVDPNISTNAIGIAGPTRLTLTEGGSTNVLLQFTSPGSPLVLVSYAATNPAPTFVSLGGIGITNTPGAGTAVAHLALNPLNDTAGDHDIQVRAVARDGTSTNYHLALTILHSPTLQVTRWKDPVDGLWTDPIRWTAGVPTPDTVAVLDQPGSYTVTVNAQPAARGLVLDSTNALLNLPIDITLGAPTEVRAGTVRLSPNHQLSVGAPLVNQGTIQLHSRDVNSYINGQGEIENLGLIEVLTLGSGGGWAQISLPVTTLGPGRWTVDAGGRAYLRGGGSLTLDGTLDLEPDGWLVTLNEAPARAITLMAGGRMAGGGTLQIQGANQLVMAGDGSLRLQLQVLDSATVAGMGTLSIDLDQTLTGSYTAPVSIGNGVAAWSYDATFWNALTVQPAGTLAVSYNHSMSINGVVTNFGTLRLFSRDVNTYLSGAGRIENPGLMEVASLGSGGGWANLYVPINVPAGGRLALATESRAYLRSGSSLALAGTLDIQPSARMVSLNEAPSRDLTLLGGNALTGGGVLQLDGGNRLVAAAPAELGLQLQLNDSASVIGTSILTVGVDQTFTGNFATPIRIKGGVTVWVSDATFRSQLEIDPGGVLDVAYNHSLILNGTLTNAGTLRMFNRDVNTYISGSGRIDCTGTLESVALGSGGGWAQVSLPVALLPGGRWTQGDESRTSLRNGSSLVLDGVLEIRPSARMVSINEGSPRDITLHTPASLIGGGVLELDGSNRFVVDGVADLQVLLQLADNSIATGTGSLTINLDQTLTGTFTMPVRIHAGVTAWVSDAVFGSSLEVAPAAVLAIAYNHSLILNGTLTNAGTLRMFSRDVNTYISGSGRIESPGTLQAVALGGGGGWTHVYVPVRVPSGGRWQLDPESRLMLRTGSTLELGGTLSIASGAHLTAVNEAPPRDITLTPGARVEGTGALELDGANRLTILEDATLDAALQLNDSARVTGPGNLTLGGTQNLGGVYESPITIASGSVVGIQGATFSSGLTIATQAVVSVNYNRTLTLNGASTNFGTLQMFSRDVNTSLAGTGHLLSHGLIKITPVGGGGGWGHLYLPTELGPAGRLWVESSAWLAMHSGAALTVGGVLQIDPGGLVEVENDGPARDVTLLPGSSTVGSGTLRLYGANGLVVGESLHTALALQLRDSSHASGEGELLLSGDQSTSGRFALPVTLVNGTSSLQGVTFDAPVLLGTGAAVALDNVLANDSFTIAASAAATLVYNRTLTLNGASTNFGTLQMFSRDVNTALAGAGSLESPGRIEARQVGGGGGVATVSLPIHLPPTGALAAVDAAYVAFVSGSGLGVDGSVTLGSGSSIWFDGSSMTKHISFGEGSSMAGPGALTLFGSTQLSIDGSTRWTGCSISLRESSSAAGTGLLTLAAGATLSIDHSVTFPGSLDVAGTLQISTPSATVKVLNSLQLEPGGTVNNSGILEAGVYLNLGGTLIGHAPVVIGPPPPTIARIDVTPLPAPTPDPTLAGAPPTQSHITLRWSGPLRDRFLVESSLDLLTWHATTATLQEAAPGQYTARLDSPPGRKAFYRLRTLTP